MAVLDKEIQILMLKGEKGDLGGVTNYEELTNKPKINGVDLIGNKTASDLSLAPESVIGSLSGLTTTEKTNLVSAINEVNSDTVGKNSEAGTWTLTLINLYGTSDPVFTFTYSHTWYYRIDKLVYVTAYCGVNVTASPSDGYACVGGLPFAVVTDNNGECLVKVVEGAKLWDVSGSKFAAGTNYISLRSAAFASAAGWPVGQYYVQLSGVYVLY